MDRSMAEPRSARNGAFVPPDRRLNPHAFDPVSASGGQTSQDDCHAGWGIAQTPILTSALAFGLFALFVGDLRRGFGCAGRAGDAARRRLSADSPFARGIFLKLCIAK